MDPSIPYNFKLDLISNIETYYNELKTFVQTTTIGNPYELENFILFLNYLTEPDPSVYYNELIPLFETNKKLEEFNIDQTKCRWAIQHANYPITELVNQIFEQLNDLIKNPIHLPHVINHFDTDTSRIDSLLESFGFKLIKNKANKRYQIYTLEEGYELLIQYQRESRKRRSN